MLTFCIRQQEASTFVKNSSSRNRKECMVLQEALTFDPAAGINLCLTARASPPKDYGYDFKSQTKYSIRVGVKLGALWNCFAIKYSYICLSYCLLAAISGPYAHACSMILCPLQITFIYIICIVLSMARCTEWIGPGASKQVTHVAFNSYHRCTALLMARCTEWIGPGASK